MYLFLIALVLICSLFLLIVYILFKNLGRKTEEDFIVNVQVLTNIIDIYKESILLDRIEDIKRQYDLNPKSQTNSIKVFEKQQNDLISEATKEIINTYISRSCFKTLLRYYGLAGLGLLIITHLKW